jgi:oxygen-independent coproporphyrinogen-3 oxidase
MNTVPPFDAALLERYDRPGPRYTSYPTAPQFTAAFGEAQLREQARHSEDRAGSPRPISLYVHIPYCSSPCFYCGCNRIITRDEAKGASYLRHLQREIALAANLFARRREVVQLHLGGGTPNFLRPDQLAELISTLKNHFSFSADLSRRDYSIELDPRFLQDGDIERLQGIGFNRVSLGVQDFAPEVQRAINRIQSVEQTLATIDACRASGMRSVNVDLIYGLPLQTVAGFTRTLETLLAVRPDRFAIYGYAHMPQLFKAQRQIASEQLPEAATRLHLLQSAIEKLGSAGYQYIGMDHFALPEDDLSGALRSGTLHRNFMGYTTHADCDLLGLGVSAISHIGASFSQNARDVHAWEQALQEGHLPVSRGLGLDRDDELRAHVIQQLMCQGQLDIGAVEQAYCIDFASYFARSLERLEPLVSDGLVTIVGNYISATPRGRLLMRVIAMCFDRYLPVQAANEERPRFSKVV